MKSFSRIIYSREQNTEFQSWTPNDLCESGGNENEIIRTNTYDLFQIKQESSNSGKANVLKLDYKNLQKWQPENISNINPLEKKDISDAWVPFIEKVKPEDESKKVLEEARLQAEEILAQANQEADQIRQNAQEQGLANANAETKETLQAVNTLITVARDWRMDMMRQAEPMVIDLVKKMGQKIFGDGLVLDNAVLQQHFGDVLESARSLGDLRIYMNPEDVSVLGPDWREFQASVIGHKVDIISNDSIKRGGCYIQGEWGTADALVETQLEAILNQFSEVEAPVSEDE